VFDQVPVLDPATNRWTMIYPLRTAYYSFISAVLFFLPIVIMTIAYVLIIWKLWSSKRPGEALGPELKTYDNVKKRVSINVSKSTQDELYCLLNNDVLLPTVLLKCVFLAIGDRSL